MSTNVWILLAIGAALALVITLIILNFASIGTHVRNKLEHQYGAHDPQFLRTMENMMGPPMAEGNQATLLCNGDEIFPAMLEAIRGARHSVTFETFIYWSAPIGKDFADSLAERARAGVKVHVLLDWLGSNKINKKYVATMENSGVEIKRYRPLRWYNLSRLNKRTHRKLLVVDGRIGFTGGVGIAGEWTGNAQDPEHWRDSHFRVEGPVVAQIQGAFVDHWTQTTGQVLHGPDYFPPLEPVGKETSHMFTSSPRGGGDSMELMYLVAITAAKKSVCLSAAYFVPDKLAQATLQDARARGVTVQVIAPGKHTDQQLVRLASRSRWGHLLKSGVEIFEYQPTMYHCKVLIVDEIFVSVGSTNFDPRSFGLNDEANLNVHNEDFARRQVTQFQKDLQLSRKITYEEWEKRSLGEKICERIASMLGRAL